MPSAAENILLSLKQKKFTDVISSINTSSNLVNTFEPDTRCSLLQLIGLGITTDAIKNKLVNLIVSHPDLELSHMNQEGETNIDEIITIERPDLVALVIKNPKFLLNKDKLTYLDAKAILNGAESSLLREKLKNPSSKASIKEEARVAELKQIVAMLRDATILHAINTDNADLFTQLKAAGAAPLDKLGKFGNENYPTLLMTQKNVKLTEWLKKEQTAKQEADTHAANPNGIFATWQQAEAQMNKLHDEYDAERTALLNQGITSKLATLTKVKEALATAAGPSAK